MPKLWTILFDCDVFLAHTLDAIMEINNLAASYSRQYYSSHVRVGCCWLSVWALLMVKTQAGIINEYKTNEREGKTNWLLEQELSTFQIQTDPDETIFRILLIAAWANLCLGTLGCWTSGLFESKFARQLAIPESLGAMVQVE